MLNKLSQGRRERSQGHRTPPSALSSGPAGHPDVRAEGFCVASAGGRRHRQRQEPVGPTGLAVGRRQVSDCRAGEEGPSSGHPPGPLLLLPKDPIGRAPLLMKAWLPV